jgi:lipoprotein-anchoring transpeptidase ErfK/SrfK
VRLDRAAFSPGEIDGSAGPNLTRATEAYRRAHRVGGSGVQAVLEALKKDDPAEPLVDYTITAEDTAGPFLDKIPTEPADQAALPALSYTSVVELIGERTHASPALLKKLNPGATFAAGETIRVPNVAHAPIDRAAVDRIVVSRRGSGLTVYAKDGRALFFAPVTSGSEHDPLPIGHWTVKGVSHNPPFHYNPALFWDAEPGDTKTTIPPGPNGPVGTVWIDLSKPHYGIHGTAEPGQVGHAASHGCVRLTNWDAEIVAALVRTGTLVVFEP